MRVRLAVAAPVKSVFINVQAMAAGACRINMGILFTNYPQFILYQYQEVDKKPFHSAKPKRY